MTTAFLDYVASDSRRRAEDMHQQELADRNAGRSLMYFGELTSFAKCFGAESMSPTDVVSVLNAAHAFATDLEPRAISTHQPRSLPAPKVFDDEDPTV